MNKAAVQNLVKNYSIETTIPQAERIERFAPFVPPGTQLYIAHIPGTKLPDTVQLASRLRREGMEPVPHVVARNIAGLRELEDFLARLSGEAGVRQVLIVAGDSATPAGGLISSLQILESGLLEKYRIRTVGVAGHPEGHPAVSDSILRDALRRKNAYAGETGAHVYVVTQFTFSAVPVIAWERSHDADIGRMPVMVGLPGLASAKTLLKYAMDCGIGASVQAFAKRYSSLTKLLTISSPDLAIVALADHCERAPQSHVRGLHFFTFGGFAKTADWANKIVSGDFDLTEEGGIRV
jgi:methylenetetrahydrofolate reductase (NADPH)